MSVLMQACGNKQQDNLAVNKAPVALKPFSVVAARVLLGCLQLLNKNFITNANNRGEFQQARPVAGVFLETANTFYSTLFKEQYAVMCPEILDAARWLWM